MSLHFGNEVTNLLQDIQERPRLADQEPDFPDRVKRLLLSVYEDLPELPQGANLDNFFYPFVIEALYIHEEGESRGVIDHIARDTLGTYSHADNIPDRRYMLEERLRNTQNAPRLRLTVLKEIGQVCLFNAGLFKNQRRGPRTAYWAYHGRSAYQEAADIAQHVRGMRDMAETFAAIGAAFDHYIAGVQRMARDYFLTPNMDLVRGLRTNTAIDRHEALSAGDNPRAAHLTRQIDYLDLLINRKQN